ncbi:MAG: hypothetical protein PHV59_03150 [Victivallales bacterium]|nr:hypothetical protein [Victivallales bacterium]
MTDRSLVLAEKSARQYLLIYAVRLWSKGESCKKKQRIREILDALLSNCCR